MLVVLMWCLQPSYYYYRVSMYVYRKDTNAAKNHKNETVVHVRQETKTTPAILYSIFYINILMTYSIHFLF